MVEIKPQMFRVGTRRPITHAVIVGGRFYAYSNSFCGAMKAAKHARSRHWLRFGLTVGWLVGIALARNACRWP